MSLHLVISPAAEADMDEARSWYEQRQQGLGDDFVLCVSDALASVCRNPETFPPLHKGVRRATIRRFPYGIFYRVEDDNLVVLAVLHDRRGPRQWKSRA